NKANVQGTVSITFPIATQTVLNRQGIDVGGQGAEQEESFTLPKKAGKLDLTVTVPNLPGVKGIVQKVGNGVVKVDLVRTDGKVIDTKTGSGTINLSKAISAADLAVGTTFKIRLTNNGPQAISGIREVAKFTPN